MFTSSLVEKQAAVAKSTTTTPRAAAAARGIPAAATPIVKTTFFGENPFAALHLLAEQAPSKAVKTAKAPRKGGRPAKQLQPG